MIIGFVLVVIQYFLSDAILNFYIRVVFLVCCGFLFFINPLFNYLSMLGAREFEKKRNNKEEK